MSALLLDTHILLWYAEGVADRLRPAAVRKLEDARKGDGLLVSAISVWEIGMHSARGRIQLAVPFRDWVDRALAVPGIRLAPLDAATAVESTLLPGEPHGDPADRFLIATARTLGVALATRDEQIIAYAKLGFLRVVVP
ncbi:MAG: type II toxin-antitoxin system VapC family toxin [Steroidobacteraceae bacterium]